LNNLSKYFAKKSKLRVLVLHSFSADQPSAGTVSAGLGKNIIPKGKTEKDAVPLEIKFHSANVSSQGIFSLQGQTTIPIHSAHFGIIRKDVDFNDPRLHGELCRQRDQMERLEKPNTTSSYQAEWKLDYRGTAEKKLACVKVVGLCDKVNNKDVLNLFILAVESPELSDRLEFR